ncbi:unnamed protein product [Sphagnum troendelagicum]
MSTVDKMVIKGIRSFSPENTRVITFFRPLTLIVGPNGAGKTTIIECLKHACTGELPPNARSGHTFIHDPKVAGETETKGQIKLRFKTAAGKDVVCIRSFQLTQKASKMEYKAIESVLQTINSITGEKVCLSYRCADMDREVPALMGVSKAILENVIFVHQDEANWPLAEASVLKKKFDDIFSATRYTKALEVIKKLHKDQAQDIKIYKVKLENLQTLKDAAYKLQESIEQDRGKSEFLHAQIQELEKKVNDTRERIGVMEVGLKEVCKLQEERRIMESQREMLKNLRDKQLRELAEENEDTDEELKTWQKGFHENIAKLRLKELAIERDLKDLENVIKDLGNQYIQDCKDQGELQAEVKANAEVKETLELEIRRVFAEHNLGDVGTHTLCDDEVRILVNRVCARFNDLKMDYNHSKNANDAETLKLWKAVEVATNKYLQAESKVTAKEEKKKGLEATIMELDVAIASDSEKLSEHEIHRIESSEMKANAEVQKLQAKMREHEYERNIDEGKSEVAKLDKKIKDLRREKDTESADDFLFRSKSDELADKEASLAKILADNNEAIQNALKGCVPDIKDLKRQVDATLSSSKVAVSELHQKCMDAQREVANNASKIQETSSTLDKYRRDRDLKKKMLLARLNSILQQNVEVNDFPSQLRLSMEKKEAEKSQHDLADGMRRMFDPFEKMARQNHSCPCCERGFSLEEEDNFVKKQRMKASSTAEKLRHYAALVANAETRVQQLDKLRVVHDDYQKLVGDLIPATEAALKQLLEEKPRLTEVHEDQLGLLAHANAELEMVEKLQVPADRAMHLHKDIENVKKQLQELEVRLQGGRSIDEITGELASVEEKRDDLHRKVERMQEDYNHLKDDLTSCMLQWHTRREEKIKALNMLTEFNRKKAERQKVEDEISQATMDVEIYEQALGPAKREKERIELEHLEFKKAKTDEENICLQELNTFGKEADKLKNTAATVHKFVLSRKDEQLRAVNERLLRKKVEQEEKTAQLNSMQKEYATLKGLIGNQAELKRKIDDNLQYRETRTKEEQMREQIEHLEQQLVSKGELSVLEAGLKRVLSELQSLLSELNRSQGTIAVYESNIVRSKADLRQSQYKDIDKRFCSQLIQLKTTEMANKDLDKYYNALDRALMRFHSMKMEEINKIIKELWQQTYRGHDIDYIEIRSDAEGAGTRSYSYRVVMRSGDAELEMRGRCSAGQKVLASLIIRLALAETFCLNCGILALDEPTTNLDTPNAESLAAALLRIMEDRKGQENFQLIVITHDERFAQLIGQRQHAERYYRISKDDHQHSIIETQEIFE